MERRQEETGEEWRQGKTRGDEGRQEDIIGYKAKGDKRRQGTFEITVQKVFEITVQKVFQDHLRPDAQEDMSHKL